MLFLNPPVKTQRLTGLAFIGIAFLQGCAVNSPTGRQEPTFITEVAALYRQEPNQKALFAAIDNSRKWAAGEAVGYSSLDKATEIALRRCEVHRAEKEIRAPCRAYYLNNSLDGKQERATQEGRTLGDLERNGNSLTAYKSSADEAYPCFFYHTMPDELRLAERQATSVSLKSYSASDATGPDFHALMELLEMLVRDIERDEKNLERMNSGICRLQRGAGRQSTTRQVQEYRQRIDEVLATYQEAVSRIEQRRASRQHAEESQNQREAFYQSLASSRIETTTFELKAVDFADGKIWFSLRNKHPNRRLEMNFIEMFSYENHLGGKSVGFRCRLRVSDQFGNNYGGDCGVGFPGSGFVYPTEEGRFYVSFGRVVEGAVLQVEFPGNALNLHQQGFSIEVPQPPVP